MSAQLPASVHWIELRPRDPATAGLATLRFAGGAVERSYFREENSQHYKAGVVSAPRFSARIGFGRDGFTGQTVPQASRIQIAPAEAQVFESLAGYFWKDAEITIDAGPENAATFPRVFTGTVVGESIADGVFTLTISDLSTRLDKPVCDQRFAGNGGIEGGEEAEGRTKRRSWGFVFNVEGRLLDPANSIYEFGDPAFPLSSFSALRDKGRTGPFAVLAWQGSIAATFAALQASSPAQGGGVVAPSIACAKWWTEPSGPLTADFIGTPGAGGSMAVAALIDAVSARFGGPGVASLAAANALRPAAAGLHIGDETTTGAQVIDRLALGSSLIWVAAPEGVIRLLPWAFDNDGAEVLQGQFIGRERAYAPHYRRRVGFQANNRQHSESEIAESIRLDDGVLFESLRPAEANATAGAVIPDPQTYVPGDPYPGYVRDSAGNVRDPGELLNSQLALTQGGRLTYERQDGPVEIGQITARGLEVVTEAAVRQVEADVESLQRAVTLALSETSRAQATFRDAGVYTDPATGTVRIDAIEQTRERVNLAEITLDAQRAAINLRATTSYVNEQIALAVIDPSQIAELSDIFFRLGAAEVNIDGLDATVSSLATVTELSLVAGRVTDAETAIDALEGTITSKVDTSTFDLLATRVTNAETTLTAIGDVASITNAVSATRLVQRQLDASTDADIRALLLGDRAKREEVAAIAAARNELGARITEQGEAQASFGLSLQARVGAAESSIATESLTRAGQFGSLAQSIINLAASLDTEVGTLQGNIDTLQQALVDETGALATSISEVSASLDAVADNLAGETQNRINAVNSATDALIDQIEAEAAARGEALTAEEQARIAALQTERDQTIADIAAEAAARNEAIGVVDARVTSVEEASVERDGAITASISRQATAVRGSQQSLDDLIDKVIAGLILSDRTARQASEQVAFAREEITAELTSAVSGIVANVFALGLRIGQAEGSIRELDRVVIENNTALVQSLDTLTLNVTTTRSDLETTISSTRTDLEGAITTTRTDLEGEITTTRGELAGDISNAMGRVDNLEGDLADEITARNQALIDEAAARIAAIEAEAAARGEALTAEEQARIAAIEDERDQTIADIAAERTAREQAIADEADARTIAISGAITAERVLWQEGDSIIAGIVDTISTTVDDNSATLIQFGESIDGLKTRWGARLDVNGRITGFVQNATAEQTDSIFVSDTFSVVDPDTGVAFLSADEDGLRLQNGKVVMNNGTNMLVIGAGFGVDSQFVMWFGPSRAINLCNEADALFFLDVTGDGEYGLRLGSNYYKNSGTGTSTASNAEVTVGPFITEGGSKQVTIGYQYRRTVQITDAFAYTGTPTATVRVERRIGPGSFETVGDYTFNGSASGEDGFGSSEPGFAQIVINQSASFTDSTGGTGDFTYRASIISRSVGGLTSTVSLEDTLTQRVPLIITEQIT